MKTIYASIILMTILASPTASAGIVDELNLYYKDALPGEAFVATPYGADSRFKPKTIWLYIDSFQASPNRPIRQNAWIAASSGESIYDAVSAPVHQSAITLPVRRMSENVKYGITASLAGTLDPVDVDAGVNLAQSKGVDLEVNLGVTEVEYVYYIDMLMAQDQNTNAVAALTRTLKLRFDRDPPVRRVVTAALRAKGGSISVRNTRNLDFSTEVALKAFLSKLGFTFNQERNTFDKLTFDDWRYIAYQSVYTNKEGKVSSAGETDPIQITATSIVPYGENAFGRADLQKTP